MTDVSRRPEAESEHEKHLRRSQTVWDRWSDWYEMSERDFEPIREELIAQIGLEEGDSVLEIGCGPGVNFEPIREAIGPDGRLVAIDYSPEMIARADRRVEEHGWDNVTVVRADATTADLGGPYDAAIATLSMSVMPDVERAVRNVYGALEPGGVLGVLDLQLFQSGPKTTVNPLLRRFLRWYANWNADEDAFAAISTVFDECERLHTYTLGTVYTLRARRIDRPKRPG